MNAEDTENSKFKILNSKPETRNPKSEIAVVCPFCSSADNEMISLFGQQMLTSQYYCNNCRTRLEAVKNPNAKFQIQDVIVSGSAISLIHLGIASSG